MEPNSTPPPSEEQTALAAINLRAATVGSERPVTRLWPAESSGQSRELLTGLPARRDPARGTFRSDTSPP